MWLTLETMKPLVLGLASTQAYRKSCRPNARQGVLVVGSLQAILRFTATVQVSRLAYVLSEQYTLRCGPLSLARIALRIVLRVVLAYGSLQAVLVVTITVLV
jgi:hypothetical protein